MKQLMVLVATIILGVAISGTVLGLSGKADNITTRIDSAISAFDSQISNAIPAASGGGQ